MIALPDSTAGAAKDRSQIATDREEKDAPTTRGAIADHEPGNSPRRAPAAPRRRPGGRWAKWVLTGLSVLVALAAIARLIGGSPDRLRAEAERAERAGDRAAAARAWRAFNATDEARGATHLAEARACLALGQAGQAELSLRRAIAADPADPEPWRLLLEILRVEDRALDAQKVVWDVV